MKKPKSRYTYRSSVTGRFVSERFARRHPRTTYRVRRRPMI
jgi:hypothetical protein